MEDLSLHILDIAENSIEAESTEIHIFIEENRKNDLLTLEIRDNGKGMSQKTIQKALDPFFTTKKTRRFGFGLSFLAEASREANGRFSIRSRPGEGTRVLATFQASHFDRKPLGDIAQTLLTLIMGHPEIDICYRHKINHSECVFDTEKIKSQLKGASRNAPEAIRFFKKTIKKELEDLRRKKDGRTNC